jgi:multicomponent Na+:H+ antiporter subunit E
MGKFKSQVVLFLILELFWILWNNTMDVKIWLYGIVPAVLILVFFGPSVDIFKGVNLNFKGFFYSIVYVFVFLWALLISNIDVIRRVLDPKLPIRPGIVRVKTKLKSPMARLILANSITLTPGTFVVDIKDDLLYIHWIEICCEDDNEKMAENISGKFENLLLKIYE